MIKFPRKKKKIQDKLLIRALENDIKFAFKFPKILTNFAGDFRTEKNYSLKTKINSFSD